jgi:hypothetical protein
MKKRKKDRKRRASTSAADIARAREGVTRAGQKLADRLARLEGVADGIETAAVERFVTEAVAELAEEQLLRDLFDLQAAFASALPDTIEPFRHLPEAMLRFLQFRFGLNPYLEAGKVLQVPSEKLDGFTLAGARGDAPPGLLVKLKVTAPGWKRAGEVVVAPRAEVTG